MSIADSLRAGLALRDYVDNNAQKQEEAKLRAQLYGAQAKEHESRNQLVNIEVQKHQKYLEGLAGALGGGQAQPAAQNLSGAFGGMQAEEQTPTFIGPPSSMSETPPTPGLSQQSGSAGPQAPGGLSVAQLHDTGNFLDPQEKILDRLSMLAVQSGLTKEYGQIQQGLIERQTIRTRARQQDIQDNLAKTQAAIATLPDTPQFAGERQMLRHLQIGLLFQLNKAAEALNLQEGKLIPFQPGGGVLQALPGEAPKVVHESKYTPYTLAKERGAGGYRGATEEAMSPPESPGPQEPSPQSPPVRTRRGAAPTQPSGTPPSPQAQIALLEADLIAGGMSRADAKKYAPIFFYGQEANGGTAPPASTPAPAPATTPPLGIGALAAAQKDQALRNQEVYGQPTPPAGQPNATVAMAEAKKEAARLEQQGLQPGNPQNPVPRQTTQAQQDARTGKPGATQADVAAGDKQAEQNVAVYGVHPPPNNQPNATAEDVARAHTLGQAPELAEKEKATAFLHSARLVQALQAVPEAKQQEYVGLLRRPKAQLVDFFADLNAAGAGDSQRYAFVANAKDLFYTINRIKVGANYTAIEKEILDGVFPDTGIASYTQFKSALDRVGPVIERQLDDLVTLGATTRGGLKTDVQKQRRAPKAEAPKAAPKAPASTPEAPETPEAQAERLRQKYGIPKRTP